MTHDGSAENYAIFAPSILDNAHPSPLIVFFSLSLCLAKFCSSVRSLPSTFDIACLLLNPTL